MKQADLALINGSILSVKSDGSRISGQAIAVTDGIISEVKIPVEIAPLFQ